MEPMKDVYKRQIFMLDMICLNEDRHLNNLAIIMNGDKFTPAPIFDNGIALLTANQSVNRHFPIADNVKRVVEMCIRDRKYREAKHMMREEKRGN